MLSFPMTKNPSTFQEFKELCASNQKQRPNILLITPQYSIYYILLIHTMHYALCTVYCVLCTIYYILYKISIQILKPHFVLTEWGSFSWLCAGFQTMAFQMHRAHRKLGLGASGMTRCRHRPPSVLQSRITAGIFKFQHRTETNLNCVIIFRWLYP